MLCPRWRWPHPALERVPPGGVPWGRERRVQEQRHVSPCNVLGQAHHLPVELHRRVPSLLTECACSCLCCVLSRTSTHVRHAQTVVHKTSTQHMSMHGVLLSMPDQGLPASQPAAQSHACGVHSNTGTRHTACAADVQDWGCCLTCPGSCSCPALSDVVEFRHANHRVYLQTCMVCVAPPHLPRQSSCRCPALSNVVEFRNAAHTLYLEHARKTSCRLTCPGKAVAAVLR